MDKKLIRWIVAGVCFGLALGFWINRYNLTYSQFVTNLKDIAIAGAAIYTALYGKKALDQWRIERLGEDRYQLAKDIALKAIEIADRLHKVRMTYVWTEEMEKAHQGRNENFEGDPRIPPDFLRNATKLELAENNLRELKLLNWKAQILGFTIEENIDRLQWIIGDLWSATETYYLVKFREQAAKDERYKKIHGTPEDEFGQRIESQKNNILKIAREQISG